MDQAVVAVLAQEDLEDQVMAVAQADPAAADTAAGQVCQEEQDMAADQVMV
jgi:hypothetical protein